MLDPNTWLSEQTESAPFLNKWQSIINLMAKIFKAPAAFIVQYTDKGYHVTLASQQEENPYPADITIPENTNIFCKRVVESGTYLYVNQATLDKQWESNPEVTQDGFNSYLGFPIRWPTGQPYGTICVMDFAMTNYDNDYVELVRLYRDLVQSDLELLNQFDQLHELAMKDELTGLHNRRGFMMLAEQRLMLARRNQEQLCLVYIDMVKFKQVNDTFGHDAGDRLLIDVANQLKDNIRESDISCRYGGDEFVILANMNGLDVMQKKLADLNALIQTNNFSTQGIATGISFGIVCIDDSATSLDGWIKLADKAMYQQKNAL